MSFTSPEFLGFVVISLLLYYLLPRRFQNHLLLIFSVIFLGTWSWKFILTYALVGWLTFWIGGQLLESPHKKWLLRAGIILNLLALLIFKYNNFFIDDLSRVLSELGFETSQGTLRLILPIGLSFAIVQMISYLLDINQGLLKPETNPINFGVYTFYFPKITSGPIERARDYLPKISVERDFDLEQWSQGFSLIGLGLVRKVVIADVLVQLVPSNVFSEPQVFSSPELLFWILVYSFILYNDFAGYTNLARGISFLFGIPLPPNFFVPYFSRNFTEFWQRWHITLSNWLRDYIFTPTLRGLLRRKYNSRHLLTMTLPPMLTMLVSGLWHNVSWGMLLWGGLHGVYQIFERLNALWRPVKQPDTYPWWRQGLSMSLVFVLTLLAWIPFRMPIETAIDYWQHLFLLSDWTSPSGIHLWQFGYALSILLIFLGLVMDVFQLKAKQEIFFEHWGIPSKGMLIGLSAIMIVAALGLQQETVGTFIYQGF